MVFSGISLEMLFVNLLLAFSFSLLISQGRFLLNLKEINMSGGS